MPDYFHVETRTCGVFLSAGRALAKRRGKTRPVLHPIPVGEVSAGGLALTCPVPKPRDRRRSRECGLPEHPPPHTINGQLSATLPRHTLTPRTAPCDAEHRIHHP